MERKRYVVRARRRRSGSCGRASPCRRSCYLRSPPGPPNTVSRRNMLIERTNFVSSVQLCILLTWFLFRKETIDEFQTYLSSFSRFWTPRKCKRESGPHPRAKRAHEIRLRASAPPAPPRVRQDRWTRRAAAAAREMKFPPELLYLHRPSASVRLSGFCFCVALSSYLIHTGAARSALVHVADRLSRRRL